MTELFSSVRGEVKKATNAVASQISDVGFGGTFDVLVEYHGMDDEFIHEWWSLNGVTHRSNGPAKILTDRETGLTVKEQYKVHGKRHRLDGPAISEFHLCERRCKSSPL